MRKKKLALSWSGGKDSAWMLHLLRQADEYEVVALVTSINEHFDRIAIHGVRTELLRKQAELAGIPLWTVDLPWPCSNLQYEDRMKTMFAHAKDQEVEYFAFGDLFLADIRSYREKQLEQTGLTPIFPLWQKPTGPLAQEMIAAGLRAKLACVDTTHVDRSFAGRDFDERLLRELPSTVDQCGENGEFHTFVYAGPMLSGRIPVSAGETVERHPFVYADLLLQKSEHPDKEKSNAKPFASGTALRLQRTVVAWSSNPLASLFLLKP